MASTEKRVFLIDDEPVQTEMLKDYINEHFDFTVHVFEDGETALQKLSITPQIIVLDFFLNSHKPTAQNGLEVLKEIKKRCPETHVIMLSGQDTLSVAVDTFKFGAFDYVVKGETSFTRIKNIINNINKIEKAKAKRKRYKNTVLALSISYVILIAVVLIAYMNLKHQ